MTLHFADVLKEWPALLEGLGVTVHLTVVATLLGAALGIACGWTRARGPAWAQAAVGIYVELFRSTPFIVQLFFIFFGLPALGIKLTALEASLIANVVNLGAYLAEITRSGIEATPKGQWEAAQCLALNRWQTFVRVVLPPALKRVWPAIVSQVVIIMLGTAVCSQISTRDLSYVANQISSVTFRSFEVYIMVAAVYLAMSVFTRRVLNWVGPRFIFGS